MDQEPVKLVPWHELNGLRWKYIKPILTRWEKLLDAVRPEEEYHEFIRQYAGLFFGDDNTHIVLSKIRLGSEFTTDFVTGFGQASMGFIYKFIEIETPQEKPYTKKGKQSERLVWALQQVKNWERWMMEHPSDSGRLFPAACKYTYKPEYASYMVIIGRRSNSKEWLDRRNRLSREYGVEIRSFDYLTDRLKNRHFDLITNFGTAQCDRMPRYIANRLANPFYEAMTEKQWRVLVREHGYDDCHFVEHNANVLIETRSYNRLSVNFQRQQG